MRRRTLPILLVVFALAGAVAVFVYYWRRVPPEAARLLPESDAVVYVDIGLLRRAGVFAHMAPVSEEPEYQRFLAETDFRFERDLDEAAFAVHAPPPERASEYPRFSEVFVGRFDSARATAWLRRVAARTDRYRDLEIFSIPHEGRTVRVALLGSSMAAASNAESEEPIRRIIENYRRLAVPFRGPSLVREHYEQVPLASLVWVIARIAGPGVSGVATPSVLREVAPGALLVGSLRFAGVVQVRLEAQAAGPPEARRIAEGAEAWLAVFRALQADAQGPGDPDVKAAVDSMRVELEGNRARLLMDVPLGALQKIAAEPPPVVGAPPETKPTPPKAKPKAKKPL